MFTILPQFEQLEQAAELLDKCSPACARLALILVDNIAEVVMYQRARHEFAMDRAFGEVIRACAEPRSNADETWISRPIIEVYNQLHEAGLAHSVEAWLTDALPRDDDAPDTRTASDTLVGGLYGVVLGGAFFGESMFHRATDASKVCLVALVDHLRRCGFELLDVQFVNPHLEQFGVTEIPKSEYMQRLDHALRSGAQWA